MGKREQADATRALIKRLCDEREWKPTQLAKASGLSPTTVYSLFDASRRHYRIRPDTLVKIANGLGVDPHVLLLADAPASSLSALLDLWCHLDDAGQVALLDAARGMLAVP